MEVAQTCGGVVNNHKNKTECEIFITNKMLSNVHCSFLLLLKMFGFFCGGGILHIIYIHAVLELL